MSTTPFAAPAPRLWAPVAACLLVLAVAGCSAGPASYATSCAAFDPRPARRVTYAFAPGSLQGDVLRETYSGRALLDDARPARTTADTIAEQVHIYERAADDYFRALQARGLGSWDGCYGKSTTRPVLTAVVHHPATTAFEGKTYGKIVYRDVDVSGMFVAREMARGLVERTLRPDGTFVQTAAIWESLADTFAALMAGQYAIRNAEGLWLSLSQPGDPAARVLGLDHFAGYLGGNPTFDAGVLNKAFHLIVEGGLYPAAPITKGKVRFEPVLVAGIGRARAEAVYFHALDPRFIPHDAGFVGFAGGLEAACRDLIGQPQGQGIAPEHCAAIREAFRAVGILTGQ